MRIRFALILPLFFLTAPGCLYHGGYYPNGYYGYGPGPSVLPSQPYNGYPPGYQPGGPVYPPGVPMNQPGGAYPSMPVDGGNPYVPQGGTSPYSPNSPGSPSTYGDGPTSIGAPTFNPTTPGTGGTGVPQPGDDDYNRAGSLQPTPGTSSSAVSPTDLSSPFEQDSRRLQRPSPTNQIVENELSYEPPVVQASGTTAADVRYANQQSEASPVSFKKFAAHPRLEWVQGVIEYDEFSSTWSIMYSDKPAASDPNGGELTLGDDPKLSQFRSGDVVRIYGEIDPSQQDSRGKSIYQLSRIESRRPVGQ